jgi:hypothetical protein
MKLVKTILTGVGAAALLVAIASSAQAQVVYSNSVLNGCYSHIDASSDTQTGALNTQSLGTFCFDGNGNVVGTTGAPDLTGHYDNTNGMVGSGSGGGGATYTVTNSPGDGMGTINDKCSTVAFSINSVDANGLAHGFHYLRIAQIPGKKCKVGPDVIGGTAFYQGPLH